MRKDVEAADRREEVRSAAHAWRRAGAIEREALETIVSEYADDRSRVGPAFRALLFLFTFVAVGAAVALFAINDAPTGALLFVAALGCIVLTEVQMGKLKRSSTGAEEATALLSLEFSVATLAWALDHLSGEFPWRFLLLTAALLAGAAAWRWGMSVFGAFAPLCLFLMLDSRPAWILLGAVLAPLLVALSVAPALAPSQRRCVDAALVVVLVGLYVAVHLGSYDVWLIERGTSLLGLYERAAETPGRWGRPLFAAATAIVPPLVLAFGIRLRRPLLLRMGLVLGIASVVTLRFYVHIAPLWVVLTASGAAAIVAALLLHHYLGRGDKGERYGFTAEPLFGQTSGARVIEVGLSAALAPGSGPSHREPGFRGGGGDFGGGGAGGSY
jgi:hypothetical protein